MCSTYWWNRRGTVCLTVKYRPASRRRLHRLRGAIPHALSCSDFSGDPAFPLGGLVSALQHLLRSLDTAVKVNLHRSMAVALMALVELRLVVAVMVADLMPWLLGAVRRHGGDYL